MSCLALMRPQNWTQVLFLNPSFKKRARFFLSAHWAKILMLVVQLHPSFGSNCQIFIGTCCAVMYLGRDGEFQIHGLGAKAHWTRFAPMAPWAVLGISQFPFSSVLLLWAHLKDFLFCFEFWWEMVSKELLNSSPRQACHSYILLRAPKKVSCSVFLRFPLSLPQSLSSISGPGVLRVRTKKQYEVIQSFFPWNLSTFWMKIHY